MVQNAKIGHPGNRAPHAAGNGDDLVRRTVEIIEGFEDGTPTLSFLGEKVGVSRFHLQRLFKKATGVSPREFAEARRLEKLKSGLREGETVTTALYQAGFGAPSRLYEAANRRLGMTPGSYAKGGRGMSIRYAVAECPLGLVLLAATEKGLCKVSLGDVEKSLADELRREYPAAAIERDDDGMQEPMAAVISLIEADDASGRDLPVDIRPTAFQALVWSCLRTIPPGETRSYGEIARQIGAPNGARAVARACAGNPLAVVIPCHRVVGADGKLRGYRWGIERKRALLDRERSGREES